MAIVKQNPWRSLIFILAGFLLTVSCQRIVPTPTASLTASPTTSAPDNLLVSAAASLKDVLEELKPVYQATKPGAITYNLGASGALQQQIENGAPADVFISAAQKQMDTLEKKGLLVEGTRINLVGNQLVLIVPRESSEVNGFSDLSKPAIERVAIGEPRSVPAGQYAQQVLENLGVWEQVRPKLVLANSVRQVLASVESGNATAGIVYATDAKTSKKVRIVATANEKDHQPIVYPIAVLKNSKQAIAGKEFIRFLTSALAQATFQKYGFTVPSRSP
ncbi:MAG TPA: molybdate ABC transporter substrate-binding protein [Thermosynechococcaceae cyanobacterium]